ncbi:hypothetical protein AC1031_013574 [Aphanomyces cochlioides]|nr:hypothetical protein AC1031_013574 [Aphanomyces cochlioides]
MSDDDQPCRVCGSSKDEELLVLCDGCDAPYHTFCHHGCVCCQQKPRNNFNKQYPVPEGDWFCKFCTGHIAQRKGNPLSGVYAWGDNKDGQLGLGTDDEIYSKPTRVPDLDNISVRDIAVGESTTLVLANEGHVYSCGTGCQGQLGHNDVVHEKLTRLRKIDGFEKRPAIEGRYVWCHFNPRLDELTIRLNRVFSGRDFSVVLTQNGHLYTWGNGESGQLGHQENKIKKIPKKVSALREQEIPVVLAAAGSDFMVMTSGVAKEGDYFHRDLPGVLLSMGVNTQGQLGDASLKNQWVPQLLNPQGPASTSVLETSLALFNGFPRKTAVLKKNLPLAFLAVTLSPLRLAQLMLLPLSRGISFLPWTCLSFSRRTQGAWSWGYGESGQLGHPKPPVDASASKFFRQMFRVLRPRFIQALERVHVTEVACGDAHTLFLTQDHRVYGSGSNALGQLGHELTEEKEVQELPQDLKVGEANIRQIAAGAEHSFAVTLDGDLLAWGRNDMGQLGLGHTDKCSSPTLVADLPKKFASIHTGYNSTFLVEFAQPVATPANEDKKSKAKGNSKGSSAPAKRARKK